MNNVPEQYASMVFSDSVMRERLPKDVYRVLKTTINDGTHFSLDVADIVANAMKDWATERGITHFCHWFQPLTGVTAEKHDSFISPRDGKIIMEFSGKELVRGEPDASSLPSGGLRSTFEARGYTAWDPTSYAFIKGNTLYIPTAFCSYSGEALDKKTPLLRSMEAIDTQAKRVLKLFGESDVHRVITTVGAEQEYFLIDKDFYEKRPDLIYCGRTLYGSRPPKGQEMEDHYFGTIKSRVQDYMIDLEQELWKLGIPAKTKHNEVAPAQHELAPIFELSNIAADHNQLTMELMRTVAAKHGLVCLLHEKPFAGVNGNGKHNNWSMSTDTGVNLLEPGDTPSHNARFLLFLSAIIKAVDENQDMLRLSVASAGNDHRLGANEAPPAIISIFLGTELTEILEALEKGTLYSDKEKIQMEIGATVLPHFPKDTTDRNRTSPFAFTGNKFEFRMPGSAISIAGPNTVLNTIVADALSEFASELEGAADINASLTSLVVETIKKHKRIIFNGNNYSDEWVREADRRGLLNLKTTVDVLPCFIKPKNIALFKKHGVYSESEIRSRYEILLENYCKTIHIEALTMIDMAKREITPSVIEFQGKLAGAAQKKQAVSSTISIELETNLLDTLAKLSNCLYNKVNDLESAIIGAKNIEGSFNLAKYYKDSIFSRMTILRGIVDELETMMNSGQWPFPSYGAILYSVK